MKNETFVKFYTNINKSKKINWTDKIIITEILNWENDNKECFISNQALAEKYGVTVKVIKLSITKLNKFQWFVSKENSHHNDNGTWINSKRMTIDLVLFLAWLNETEIETKVIKTPSMKKEPKVTNPINKKVTNPINKDINDAIVDTQTVKAYTTTNTVEKVAHTEENIEIDLYNYLPKLNYSLDEVFDIVGYNDSSSINSNMLDLLLKSYKKNLLSTK